jgi:hypothetical protein
VSPVNDLDSGRRRVEQPPSQSPGGWPAPRDADSATEVTVLAALLAEVVELAGNSAVFPSRWALIAELALEHDSVRTALRAEQTATVPPDADSPPSGIAHIITRLDQLHDLSGGGNARC